MPELVGHLSRLQFQRENFVIARLRIDASAQAGNVDGAAPTEDSIEDSIEVGGDSNGEVCIKGTMIAPQLAARYTLAGEWETHPRFGRQFAFASYEVSYPSHAEGVIDYLTELPGIGPTIAARILGAFWKPPAEPRAAIEALRRDPALVARTIKGFPLERAEAAAHQLAEQEQAEASLLEVKHLLGGTAIGKPAIKRIVDRWGKTSPDVIRKDAYILAREIRGVGFHSADQIARRLPPPFTVELDSPARIAAGMTHVLEGAAAEGGHTCLPVRAFACLAAELLGLADETILDHMAEAHKAGSIQVIVEQHEPDPPAGGHVFHPRLMQAEFDLARYLLGILSWSSTKEAAAREAPEPVIDGLHEDQVAAVKLACSCRVMLLTGAPGTGKTHTLRAILATFRGRKIALCAPTGKAAKRMTEATDCPASTIHSLLRPDMGASRTDNGADGWAFKHGPHDPLPVDLLICDEVSMMDVSLARALFSAVKMSARLILIGDSHQLPSVGPGNVLADLVASGVIPHVELTTIKRQNPGLIVTNCHRVKDGKAPIWPEPGKARPADDFFLHALDEPDEIRAEIVRLVVDDLPALLDIHMLGEHAANDPALREKALRAIQVISPLREKTELSCDALNELLQEKLNPATEQNRAPVDAAWGRSSQFRIGDKIIQTRNDHTLGVINGDLGYLRRWLPNGAEGGDGRPALLVAFEAPDRELVIPATKNNLELAYALTAHKYQGSETLAIVIPMHRCFGSMIVQRNWIYTAISRAQRICIVVGQPRALLDGCRRTNQAKRCSRLAAHLRRGMMAQNNALARVVP